MKDQKEKEFELAKLQWEIDTATKKLELLEDKIDKLNDKVDLIDKNLDKVDNKVEDTNKALTPITKIVYGLIGLILVTFFTILASYVFRTPNI